MQKSINKSENILWIGLSAVIIIGVCFFWNLGSYGLLNNNEGLYAEIAREMLFSQDYVIPYLNGVPYIEKPPLLYWLITLSYKCFGISETSARLVPACAGILTIVLTVYTVRKFLSAQTAVLVLILLGNSIGYILICRMVLFESVFGLFMTLSLLCFFIWDRTQRFSVLRIGYAALACAVLTKGLLSIALSCLVVISYNALICKPVHHWFKVLDGWGVLIFLVITAPWHILACYRESGFARFYFINEHFLRYLGLREPHDYYHGPFYYYIHRLLGYLAPWSFLLGALFFKPPKPHGEISLITFVKCWFVCFFIFFSLSQAKANYYLLIALPPLIIWLAYQIEHVQLFQPRLIAFLASVPSLLIGCIALLFIIVQFLPTSFALASWITEIRLPLEQFMPLKDLTNNLWVLVLFGMMAIILSIKGCPKSALLSSALLNMLLIIKATNYITVVEEEISARPIVQKLALHTQQVCFYQDFEKMSSFTYYMQRPLPIIDSQSNDLLYGQKGQQRPDLFLSTHTEAALPSYCSVVLVHNNRKGEFQHRFPDLIHLYKSPRFIVFARQK